MLTIEERIRMLSSEVGQCLNLEPDLFNISSAVIDEEIHIWIEHENQWIELDPYGVFDYGAGRGVTAVGETLHEAIVNEEKRYRLMEGSRITRAEFLEELRKNGIPFDEHIFPFGDAQASWRHDRHPQTKVLYANLDWGSYPISRPTWLYQGYGGATLAAAIKRFKSRYYQ